MPEFTYTMTRGSETRTTTLRRSNPQGWLIVAVKEAFPELYDRRATDLIRLRLEPVNNAVEAWKCTLPDPPASLVINVIKSKK